MLRADRGGGPKVGGKGEPTKQGGGGGVRGEKSESILEAITEKQRARKGDPSGAIKKEIKQLTIGTLRGRGE